MTFGIERGWCSLWNIMVSDDSLAFGEVECSMWNMCPNIERHAEAYDSDEQRHGEDDGVPLASKFRTNQVSQHRSTDPTKRRS
jgi:hypothetical protein